ARASTRGGIAYAAPQRAAQRLPASRHAGGDLAKLEGGEKRDFRMVLDQRLRLRGQRVAGHQLCQNKASRRMIGSSTPSRHSRAPRPSPMFASSVVAWNLTSARRIKFPIHNLEGGQMAKKRSVVASAFKSTRRAIGRYLPGRSAEAKAEAAIDNLLVLLGQA